MLGTRFGWIIFVTAIAAGCGAQQAQITAPVSDETTTTTHTDPAAVTRHLCQQPINAPGQVWPRIQSIRALPEADRTLNCGLDFVELLSKWRPVPVDLLGPIVARAKADAPEALELWLRDRFETKPEATMQVMAMDVVGLWKPGLDPSTLPLDAKRWVALLNPTADLENTTPAPFTKIAEEATVLPTLLEKVTEIHRLRCLLETNPMGFAMACTPIHRQGSGLEISWETETRDGLIKDLKITKCKGKSCRKLKKTAQRLLKTYLDLADDIERLTVHTYKEQLETWLKLPPSTPPEDDPCLAPEPPI